jgi:lysophospholipase L1-like esterase
LASGKPLALTGRYNIGEIIYYAPAVRYMGAGADPRILGALVPNKDSVNTGTTVNVDFKMGTLRRSDTLAPSYRRPFAEKSLWLGKGDQRKVERKALDVGVGQQVINDFPGSDTWTAGSYGSSGATGIGFSLTTANRWTGIVWTAHGGMELSASVKADQGDANRGVLVLCTKGYFVFWADATGVGNYGYKYAGGGFASANVDWDGRTTHASWQAANVDWTVRLYDFQTIGVLLNGVEVYRYTLPEGEVVQAGFMGMRTGTNAGLSIEFPSAARLSEPQGGQAVKLAAFGDSKTDGYFGSWTDAFREALDGSAGVRVTQIVNRAVSGQNSLAQLGVMTANPPTGMTDVVIHVGTNDVQGGADASVTLANIDDMIDLCVSNGVPVGRVHLVVPDLWYDQAEAGGFGEDTSAFETGERTRMAILKLGSDRGCKVVNLSQVLGPVLGSQITTPDISDPRLRDNIHPTSFAYRVIGMEIAKSVLNAAAPAMVRAVQDRAIPGSWANGWTANADAPVYRVSEEGVLSMGGTILPATRFGFSNTADGWTATNSSIATAADGITVTNTASDPYVSRSGLSIPGGRLTRVVVDLTRTANPTTAGWDGTIYYSTAGHAYAAGFTKTTAANPTLGVRTQLVFDMANLTTGGSDWINSIITGLRLDLDLNSGGAFKIHSINVTPGYSYPIDTTKSEGTTILTLPRNLWPRTTARLPVWGGTGFAAVEVSAGDGSVKIYGAASASYLALDAISFSVRSVF